MESNHLEKVIQGRQSILDCSMQGILREIILAAGKASVLVTIPLVIAAEGTGMAIRTDALLSKTRPIVVDYTFAYAVRQEKLLIQDSSSDSLRILQQVSYLARMDLLDVKGVY